MMAKRRRRGAGRLEPRAAITATGLSKRYGDLVALQPVDVDIQPGEFVGLIGHNGSGKSTFLKLCAGQLEPSDGRITVSGHDAGTLEARARLSYLPDDPLLYDDLSLWEHVEYLSRLHGASDWTVRAAPLLEAFALDERRDDLPLHFSRGLRQKSALLLGLLRPFEVLVIDEPFVGLDASGKAALVDHLTRLHDEGKALVVATHDLQLLQLVDRCVALRDGAVVHDGPIGPEDVTALAG
jgi:ABC-2 type transport system ATP-binding protein